MTTLAQRRKRPVTIGPADHGRRMSLAMFEHVDAADDHVYELARGVIEMVDVPGRNHRFVENEVRKQFSAYEMTRPNFIHWQGVGSSVKLLITSLDSVRHADWVVYLTAMPEQDQPWEVWRPNLVVEIVSPSSIKRDYIAKAEEYLAIGIDAYWILDPIRRQMVAKANVGGIWRDKVHKPAGRPVTTPLLPGFAFDLKRALNAAK